MFQKVNGIDLFYEKRGEGRPLVLVHGNGEDHTIFDEAVRRLETRFCCYAVDSRCHGQSGEGPLHYADMAADLLAFLEALDLRDVIFSASATAASSACSPRRRPIASPPSSRAGQISRQKGSRPGCA